MLAVKEDQLQGVGGFGKVMHLEERQLVGKVEDGMEPGVCLQSQHPVVQLPVEQLVLVWHLHPLAVQEPVAEDLELAQVLQLDLHLARKESQNLELQLVLGTEQEEMIFVGVSTRRREIRSSSSTVTLEIFSTDSISSLSNTPGEIRLAESTRIVEGEGEVLNGNNCETFIGLGREGRPTHSGGWRTCW